MIKGKVLIVDGDMTLIEILKSRLEKRGYLVDAACTGKEALNILKDKWVDVIVISIILQGGMSGYQFFKEIKKKKDFSEIPIIVQSEKPSMKKTFEMMGADIFLIKPYRIETFLDKIKKFI